MSETSPPTISVESMSSSEDSPVRTSPAPGPEEVSERTPDPGSPGETCSGSSASSLPAPSSSKTSRAEHGGGLERLCESLELRVIDFRPYLSGLLTWGPRISESASSSSESAAETSGKRSGGSSDRLRGSWPTPTTADKRGSGSARVTTDTGRHPGLTLTDAVVRGIEKAPAAWPTPATRDWKSSASNLHGKNSRPLNEVVRLEEESSAGSSVDADGASSVEEETSAPGAESAQLYPTPSATSYGSNQGGAAGRVGKKRESLEQMARAWPTPTAEVGTGYRTGNKRDIWRPNLQGAVNGLEPQRVEENWATPRSSDAFKGFDVPTENRQGGVSLGTQVRQDPSAQTWATPNARDEKGPTGKAGRDVRSSLSDQAMPGATAGRLNPRWVLQLMGFPSRWLSTASRPAAAKRSTRGKSRERSRGR